VITEAKKLNIPVLIDPAREGDYTRYRGAALLKPNRYEAAHATGTTIAEVRDAQNAARQLHQVLEIEHIVITLDRDGMIASRRSELPHHIPSQVRDVYDITGAGDMSFAVLGLGFASGIDLCQSVALANVASGWEVQHEGVVVMTRDELMAELHGQRKNCKTLDLGQLEREISRLKQQGKRIVFTNGCFDLLHVGHVTYLQEAAALGDILIVAVNGDGSVRRLKGPTRPVISESDRAAMLAALACVDYVIVFHEDTPCALLETLQPDVLVKGGTYRPEEVVGHEIVTAYGGEIIPAGVVDGVSTTRILASLNKAA